MKKNKVVPLTQKTHDEDELFIIDEINNGLETLEHHFEIPTPNIDFFEKMVVEEKKKAKKKLYRDLGIFAIVAMLVLTGVLFTLYEMPIVFMVLQGTIAVGITIYSSVQYTKQVNHG